MPERQAIYYCTVVSPLCFLFSDVEVTDPVDTDDDDDDYEAGNRLLQSNEESASDDDDEEDLYLTRDDDEAIDSDDDEEGPRSIDTLQISELLTKCRTIIKTIRKSSILNDELLLLARNSSIKVGLILDMRVRWNSSFAMIKRLITFQSVLEQFYTQLDSLPGATAKQRIKLTNARLSSHDWTLLQILKQVLERFTDASVALSGDEYPTLSVAYAIIFSLRHYLNGQAGDPLESAVKQLLQSQFDHYVSPPAQSKTADMIRIAALLDPVIHDLLTPEDKDAAEKSIITEVWSRIFTRAHQITS